MAEKLPLRKKGSPELSMTRSDYYNAGRSFRALVKVTPFNTSPSKFLDEYLIESGNLRSALKVYKKFSALESLSVVYDKLGAICVELQIPNDALNYLSNAEDIDKFKNNSDILSRKYLLGLAYLQLKNYSQVEKELN
jgi:predicted Zn-dependent protease